MIKQTLLSIFSTLAILSTTMSLQADIVESNEITTVRDYATADTLVLFNVTGVLYGPSTTFGDNRWRMYFADRVNEIVKNREIAQQLIDKVKSESVLNIPKKALEPITAELIVELQNNEIPVFGITKKLLTTSYAENFALVTSNHLHSINIELEKTMAYFPMNKRGDDDTHAFLYGMIFTSKKPVGQGIVGFLKRLVYQPTKIVLIDNERASLEEAEAALAETGIAFQGIRYGRSDDDQFDPTLGTIEFMAWTNDKKVMSDEEALQIKQSNPTVNYEMMLDAYIQHRALLLEKNSTA